MIKSLSLLTRKSAMSKEEFRRIWVGEHAPLVHAVPQVRRYVLSFVLDELGLGVGRSIDLGPIGCFDAALER